jgi:hypothetical protein
MILKRKIFSSLTQEEKEDYIRRNREFRKLKYRDRLRLPMSQNDRYLKAEEVIYDPKSSKEEVKEAKKRLAKEDAGFNMVFLGGAGAIKGGLLNSRKFNNNPNLAGATKGALVNGAIGTALGAGVTGAQAAIRNYKSNKVRSGEGSEKFKRRMERTGDARKVALGKMTADEFKDKWYNKD